MANGVGSAADSPTGPIKPASCPPPPGAGRIAVRPPGWSSGPSSQPGEPADTFPPELVSQVFCWTNITLPQGHNSVNERSGTIIRPTNPCFLRISLGALSSEKGSLGESIAPSIGPTSNLWMAANGTVSNGRKSGLNRPTRPTLTPPFTNWWKVALPQPNRIQ